MLLVRRSRCQCKHSCCTCRVEECRFSAWELCSCSCSRHSRLLLASTTVGYLCEASLRHLTPCPAFSQFAPSSSTNPKSFLNHPLQKIVYILCNLLTLGVGLWKCSSMGLLPVGTGDWLAFETRGQVSHPSHPLLNDVKLSVATRVDFIMID